MVGAANVRRRKTLRLSLSCDNQCVFCAQAGLDEPAPAALSSRLAALREDAADELTFTGGEPTLDPSLPAAVAAARAAGFTRVGVQTNGRHLAERAAELAKAGLTDVHVSLHGPTAAVHDYHTGVQGSFAALLAGVAAARAERLPVAATTVVTRSNFRELDALPPLLRAAGVDAWLLSLPHAAGRAQRWFDRVMPRLGLVLPFALRALDGARRLGLPAFVQGAPLCKLGPFARYALPDEPRAYAEVCGSCAARPGCPGVDARYLQRFSGDELRQSAAVTFESSELANYFVGPGPLSVVSDEPAPPRLRLPIAGKVERAVNEVSAAAPRKSGAELRAIFPDLFKQER